MAAYISWGNNLFNQIYKTIKSLTEHIKVNSFLILKDLLELPTMKFITIYIVFNLITGNSQMMLQFSNCKLYQKIYS